MGGFLVSAGIWVDGGDQAPNPRVRPAPDRSQAHADPAFGWALPNLLPTGATLAWDQPMTLPVRPVMRPVRTGQQIEGRLFLDYEDAGGCSWWPGLSQDRVTRPKPSPAAVPALEPPYVTDASAALLAWHQAQDRPARRPGPVPAGHAADPIIVAPASVGWDVPPQTPRPRPRPQPAPAAVVPEQLPGDQGQTLPTWAVPGQVPVRRPAPLQQPQAEAPPLSWFLDVALVRAALDSFSPGPVRRPAPRPLDALDAAPVMLQGWIGSGVNPAAWVVTWPQQPPRLRPPQGSDVLCLDVGQQWPAQAPLDPPPALPVRRTGPQLTGGHSGPPWSADVVTVILVGPFVVSAAGLWTDGASAGECRSE